MSEADAPTTFTRGSRSRASLPVVRSTNQTRDRSLGVLYLQYGEETKQIRMPNEITSGDTIRALFVSAFPQQLTMKMLESPSVAVYVKDDMRNIYYELTDVRNITDHSCLKVYHKDPAQAFSHGPRPTNGDARMHREVMYGSRDGQHPPMRQLSMGPPPHHPMQGSLSPPTAHSLPPSPSRIPFGPRPGSMPGTATMPRERISNATPPARSVSPCPSAILERRDVKPDEDLGAMSPSLVRGGEGLYADPYLLLNEGRMGHGPAHGGHPPAGDIVDHGSLSGYHRASIRSTGSYSGPSPTEAMEQPSLYRQKFRKYGDSQLPTLGSKTPPPSPHRMAEVRMIDIHGAPPPPSGIPQERSSPVRQSFRKEEVAKSRSNMASPVAPDFQGGHGPIPPANDPQTRERMKAMEQQIASLTGLVQHALLKSPNASGTNEAPSERPMKTSRQASPVQSAGGSPVLAPKSAALPSESGSTPALPGSAPFQANLFQFKKNVSDLRVQLHQMRQLQLQNQEALCVQLKRAEQEISVKLVEAMERLEDPVQRQRALVEEDRHKYLGLEERVFNQLGELEHYVDTLKRETSSTGAHRAVTLKHVEEGAVSLRRVGESLAGLRGDFPPLQTRMRSVLRVEVEAVKFLKEEPHKLDSMLKRVKSLTETLSGLRRCATTPVESSPVTTTMVDPDPPAEAPASPPALPEPQISSIRSEVVTPSCPMVIHHVQSAPVHIQQSQQSTALLVQPSPPTTPTHSQGRDSPSSAEGSTGNASASNSNPSSQGGSPAQQKKTPAATAANQELPTQALVNNGSNGTGNFFIEEIHTKSSKSKNRAMSIKAAEKEWEERRQNMGHYDGREFERILDEAQANMMKGITCLEVPSEGEASTVTPAALEDQVDSPKLVAPTTEETPPEPSSEKPAIVKPAGPEKLPKPVLEKPTTPSDKVGLEASKSPPPPPPRKPFPTSSSGMTTTRSGEVVYPSRNESASGQEEEEAEIPVPAGHRKPTKVPSETTPSTPAPVAASVIHKEEEEEEDEEDDEGDKIMAELQVFQKCTVKDVGVKSSVLETHPTRVEPQIRELRPGALLPLKEKKSSENTREDKDLNADENGNTTPLRQIPGVIYYVTGQISKEQPPPLAPVEEAPECRDNPTQSPSQVSNVNANDNSPSQQPQPKPQQLGPPISPKPLFLNFPSPLFQKQVVSSESLKTSPGVVEGVLESPMANTVDKPQISTVKRLESPVSSVVQESSISLSKSVVLPAALPKVSPPINITGAPKAVVSATEKALSDATNQPRPKYEEVEEEAFLSPDLPGEEGPPPPDNIAFMITNTKVQALSCGEYQELVNAKQGIQTVTVGGGPGNRDMTHTTPGGDGDSSVGSKDDSFNNKKPVIIIFDEPMDIRSAYKRLSTVFECEEELESMLAAERIDEEDEESEETWGSSGGLQVKVGPEGGERAAGPTAVKAPIGALSSSSSSLSHSSSSSVELVESSSDGKPDGKKKFKFKFPKKQLAALSQAIRTGTKTGKKTLQVVVYEDEEESDGTVRQHKEAKRFEIQSRSKQSASPADMSPKAQAQAVIRREHSDSQGRTDEIRKSTYKTLDSLEQTIKQLETTISEMGPTRPHQEEPVRSAASVEPQAGCVSSGESGGLKRSLSLPSKSSLPKVPQTNKASLRKKTKPQLLPRPATLPTATITPSQQNATSVASPTSRMPVPMSAKSRQSPGTTTDKAGKPQKLQDSAQRQFRQANGSAKRAGGDYKTTSPTIPASKIPAFYPSSAKGSSSQSAPNSDATNPINLSPSSNSSSSSPHTTKSSIPSPYAPRHPGSALPTSSHIPSLSNGSSLKLPTPSHTGKALSFSSQTQNGRAPSSSFSSSSPSPLSPTPLGPGVKSIRTIHTPSFTSYRPQNGSSGKSCIPTATAAKDST